MGKVHIIGGGLAGSEAAWQAASLGADVVLHEMRPMVPTAVHKTDRLAELVCSNSFRGDKLDNAVGLLKEEMRRLGSLIMREADRVRVPAGAALAVDRELFAEGVTAAVQSHPGISVERGEVPEIPAPNGRDVVIVATGPLTSGALSENIARFVGREHLAFFDAISPIVLAETIDMSKVFRQSRWDRSLFKSSDSLGIGSDREGTGLAQNAKRGLSPQASNGAGMLAEEGRSDPRQDSADGAIGQFEAHRSEAGDYLNCPLSEEQYRAFHAAIVSAEKAEAHDFDNTKFFEGCLPIEVM